MSNIDKKAVQAVADLKAGYTLGHADVAILNELARIALASLEAEDVVSHIGSKNALDAIVAFIKSNRNPTLKDHNEVSERLFQDNCYGISNHVIEYIKQIGEELQELRSTQDTAPPATVSVPDEVLKRLLPDAEKAEFWFEHDGKILFEGVKFNNAVFEACRAAMLQGAEQPQNAPQNIPENIPTLRDGLAAIRSLGEIDARKIQAERDAFNAPDCWCRTCRPVTMTDMRFVVCPDCGNKRCPHANDHRHECTGSNEPGQEGSAHPTAPQQEA
ncbi:TPA: hypothetical protein O8U02_003805 [Enterobacter kobei]|nr:hypothetical protein [Enterobacter kobei]